MKKKKMNEIKMNERMKEWINKLFKRIKNEKEINKLNKLIELNK